MNIKTKITFFIGTLICIFVFIILGQHLADQKRTNLFIEGTNLKEQQFFTSLVDLAGSDVAIFAKDYTYWDEMVSFVNNPTSSFAHDNIEVSLSTFKADEVYVYNSDRELIYSIDNNANQLQPLDLTEEQFNFLYKQRLLHFFLIKDSILTEFRAATIHPSDDVERVTEPQGFFFVGKRWDSSYIKELEELSDTTITLTTQSLLSQGTHISFLYKVHDWEGKTLTSFNVTSPLDIVGEIQQASNRQIYLIIGLLFLVLLFVYIFLYIFVERPIETLSKSIKNKDLRFIHTMKGSHSEFGTLAQLILEFREHELILQAKEKDAAMEHVKRDFISLVSHELRTPLTILRWSIEKLQTQKDISGSVLHSLINPMASALNRMHSLIESILDVSKIETDEFKINTKEVSLKKIVSQPLNDLKPIIDDKKITVTVTPLDEDIVYSDERLLQIIVNNLISNAVHYSNELGSISIRMTKDDAAIVLTVTNTGQGIPEEDQQKVFSKLFRATNASLLSPNGAGLGLYISKAFLERLGGSLSFTSIPNKDTTFTVYLPRMRKDNM